MENKKDIGKAISDKLSTLDKTPRENVWSGISYELQKKKKRRIAFFFFWTKAIGLLLVGVIAALYVYTQNDGFDSLLPKDSNESIIVNSDGGKPDSNHSGEGNTEINNAKSDSNNSVTKGEDNNNETGNSSEINSKNKSNLKNGKATDNPNSVNHKNSKGAVKNAGNNSVSKSSKTKNAIAKGELNKSKTKSGKAKSSQLSKAKHKKSTKKDSGESKTTSETSTQSDINSEQNSTALFDPTSLQNNIGAIDKTKEVNTKKSDSLVAKKEKKKRIETKPEEETKKDSTETKEGFVRFHVDAFLSPTHYGYFSDKSTISRFLNSNSKSTEVEMNYGAGLSYDLTERAAIRIGYTSVKLNYTTHDALVNTQNYYGIEYKPGVTNASIYAASNGAETMDITQNMSYSEITLEGRYKFLNKKIGLSGIFGFSFLMLNDNSVSIKTSNGFGQTIGETKDLFETAASANIGFGIDYQVFKNTKVFVEPMFNYQAMSFENSNFKPYYFGLHFGIRYALINK